MANITTYDFNVLQPIVQTVELSNAHQINFLGDGTVTLSTNDIDTMGPGEEAAETVRLDELEQYRLYCVLHSKFKGYSNGRTENH